ncbi:unnamed protein product [Musa hybrid cultivar]
MIVEESIYGRESRSRVGELTREKESYKNKHSHANNSSSPASPSSPTFSTKPCTHLEMSASPELSRTAPPEFSLRPIKMAPPSKDDDEECHTPTAEESKLPSTTLSCPPAPRKPGTARRCKRRLWPESELIEIGAEEMEQVFGSRSQCSHAKKRS